MKHGRTRRLLRMDRRSISCLAVACLIIGLFAIPGCVHDGSHAAYAAPETVQATESVNTITVDDSNFATLQQALQGAKAGAKTVILLSGDYVVPAGFTHIDLPSGSDVEISVPEGSSAVLSRADGTASTSGALLVLANDAVSKLTLSGDLTYQNSTTLAYVGKGGQLTINGGTYTGNTNADGGVIYAYDATMAINGGTFSANQATNGSGGAIYLNGGSLSVKNATFSGNSAVKSNDAWSVGGGAVYAYDATVALEEGSIFSDNVARSKSRLGGGGALWVKGSLSINGATFANNASDPDGGWHCGGGAILLSGLAKDGSSEGQAKSTLTISKATFTGNEAKYVRDSNGSQGDGGAIFLGWNSTMILQGRSGDITFTNNKAARLGGAIYTEETSVTYMAKAFATDNTAGHFGGGLWLCPSGQGIASKGGNMIAVNNQASTDTDRYANGPTYENDARKEPTSGAAGDDFAIMSPTKSGISNSYELSNTGWDTDSDKQVVHWYQDGTLTKYTDGLGLDSILDGLDSKGLSVAGDSQRYATGAEEYPAGTINSENVSGKKNAAGVAQCTGNTEACVKNVGTALKVVMDASTAQQYQSKATVLFTGNHADSSGGAFGTNGAIVFANPYNAAWRKVDEKDVAAQSTQNGNRNTDVNALAGSTWTLSIKQSQITSADAQGQTVYMTANGEPTPYFSADINAANCGLMRGSGQSGLCWTSDGNVNDPTWTAEIQDNVGYDKNPGNGEFSLANLAGGTFTLTETEAPEGYYRSTKTYTFTTGETAGIPTVKVDGKDVLSKSLSGISQIGDDAKPASVAWNKVDSQSNDKLGGSTWQLLKKNGDGYAVVNGYDSIADCTSGDCAASRDKDASKGGFKLEGLSSGEYRLKETGVPTGYDDSETVTNRAYGFIIPDPGNRTETPDASNVTLVDGVYVVLMKDSNGQSMFSESGKTNIIGNERKTGSVAWNKVSAESKDKKLSGSEWRLEIKSGDNWIPLSYNADAAGFVKWLQPTGSTSPTIITDCESEGCRGADTNAKAGEFQLSGLGWGTYRLIETKAPSGFVLPDKTTTWYEFTIDAQHTGDAAIALKASGGNGSNAQKLLTSSSSDGQGQKPNTIANVAVVVQLPLTGDLTDRAWLLGGLALCALALLGNALRKRMTGDIK